MLYPPEDGGAGGRQSFWAADGTGYGWLAEEDTNRRKTEKKKKRGVGDICKEGGTFLEQRTSAEEPEIEREAGLGER